MIYLKTKTFYNWEPSEHSNQWPLNLPADWAGYYNLRASRGAVGSPPVIIVGARTSMRTCMNSGVPAPPSSSRLATDGGRLQQPHPAAASPRGSHWSIARTARPPPLPSPSSSPPSLPYDQLIEVVLSNIFCDLVRVAACSWGSLLPSYIIVKYSFVIDAPKNSQRKLDQLVEASCGSPEVLGSILWWRISGLRVKKIPSSVPRQSIDLWPSRLTGMRCRYILVGLGSGFSRSTWEDLLLNEIPSVTSSPAKV
jgi:hypothetical protein